MHTYELQSTLRVFPLAAKKIKSQIWQQININTDGDMSPIQQSVPFLTGATKLLHIWEEKLHQTTSSHVKI